MKLNLTQHPCAGKCTDFKEEQCKTCLVNERNYGQGNESGSDFLIGDLVVLDAVLDGFNGVYYLNKINENTVDVHTGIGILTVNKRLIRPAKLAEIQFNRRLTNAEQALAEVS